MLKRLVDKGMLKPDMSKGKRGARYRKIDMGEVQEFDFSLSEFTDNKTGDDD